MIRYSLPLALLLATHAAAQCTITGPGALLTPSPVDAWSAIQPIGFAFPFAGSTYTGMYITDHSMLALTDAGVPPVPPGGSWVWNPTTANFTAGFPLIAPYWSDHTDGGALGSIRVDNTSGTRCTVTWLNMQTYFALNPPFTVQVTLYPDGRIVMCLDDRVSNNGSTFGALNAIIGLASGVGPLPPMSDLSANPATPNDTIWEEWITTAANTPNPLFDMKNKTVTFIPTNPGWIVVTDTLACASSASYGSGCDGLALTTTNPVLGAVWTLTTTGLSPVSPVGITYFSMGPQIPGLPLPLIGINAPGCDVNISIGGLLGDVSGPNMLGTATVNIPVPLNASLKNAALYLQSLGLTLANPALIATSNGRSANLGY